MDYHFYTLSWSKKIRVATTIKFKKTEGNEMSAGKVFKIF